MAARKGLRIGFWVSFALAMVCVVGTVAIFLHSYYLGSYFNVHVFNDPRWRIFNFNSRQASESDIYNVAEIPAVRCVEFAGRRRLRLEFTPPIDAPSWTVIDVETGAVNTQGPHPEVQFGNEPHYLTCKFVPQGTKLLKDIVIKFHFFPTENYKKIGMSWDDNYHAASTSVPFSLSRPHSVDEWAGLPDDDPEMVMAKRILEGRIDGGAPTLERAEKVLGFVLDKLLSPQGPRPHTDRLQEASPLETYELMSSGQESGFCENLALVYYLFANAAGVKTRLVDIAGKFGPLKLTGHYFCESWIPEEGGWCYVDPLTRIANIRTPQGKLLNFLEVKKAYDLGLFKDLAVRKYDPSTKTMVAGAAAAGDGAYFIGDIVVAYPFGYGRNKSFSKVGNFLSGTTMLYAPFELPKGYLLKYVFLYGFLVTFPIALFLALIRRFRAGFASTDPD